MQALIIPVDGPTTLMELTGKDDLRAMQAAVGGYIELIRLSENLLMYVNEEGMLRNMPHNPRATALLVTFAQMQETFLPLGGDDLRGDVFLIGDDGGPDNAPIPEQWVEWLRSVDLWP
jgi:hypothetical protein